MIDLPDTILCPNYECHKDGKTFVLYAPSRRGKLKARYYYSCTSCRLGSPQFRSQEELYDYMRLTTRSQNTMSNYVDIFNQCVKDGLLETQSVRDLLDLLSIVQTDCDRMQSQLSGTWPGWGEMCNVKIAGKHNPYTPNPQLQVLDEDATGLEEI